MSLLNSVTDSASLLSSVAVTSKSFCWTSASSTIDTEHSSSSTRLTVTLTFSSVPAGINSLPPCSFKTTPTSSVAAAPLTSTESDSSLLLLSLSDEASSPSPSLIKSASISSPSRGSGDSFPELHSAGKW